MANLFLAYSSVEYSRQTIVSAPTMCNHRRGSPTPTGPVRHDKAYIHAFGPTLMPRRANGRLCSIEGCGKPHFGLGYCNAHHSRLKRHGSPLGGATFRRSASGECVECGRPSESAFCSALCKGRAARHYPSTRDRSCLACGTFMPPEVNLRRQVCTGEECRKVATLAAKYKLSVPEMVRIIREHGNQCVICGTTARLVVDHDHKTGQVRGLICGHCNAGIGFFRDNPSTLLAAAIYLESVVKSEQAQCLTA